MLTKAAVLARDEAVVSVVDHIGSLSADYLALDLCYLFLESAKLHSHVMI